MQIAVRLLKSHKKDTVKGKAKTAREREGGLGRAVQTNFQFPTLGGLAKFAPTCNCRNRMLQMYAVVKAFAATWVLLQKRSEHN